MLKKSPLCLNHPLYPELVSGKNAIAIHNKHYQPHYIYSQDKKNGYWLFGVQPLFHLPDEFLLFISPFLNHICLKIEGENITYELLLIKSKIFLWMISLKAEEGISQVLLTEKVNILSWETVRQHYPNNTSLILWMKLIVLLLLPFGSLWKISYYLPLVLRWYLLSSSFHKKWYGNGSIIRVTDFIQSDSFLNSCRI